MREFRLRTDLERVMIGDFALPLGIAPLAGKLKPPEQGYTVSYVAGEDEEPDTYSFHIVVSHERLKPIVHRAFELLPDEVFGIIEIGSRDAYRSTDTFIGQEPLGLDEFMETWRRYEPFLLEDGSIAAGANNEEPFIEIFLDQWKGLSIHVPLEMRETIENMLRDFDLQEVSQTWPTTGPDGSEVQEDGLEEESSQMRPVLDLDDAYAPDVDEILLNLRHDWKLELNIDPESNVDEGGRSLGSTLWHAVVIVDSAEPNPGIRKSRAGAAASSSAGGPENNGQQGAYASIWATATSMAEMERLISSALDDHPDWSFGEIYTIDRVAFDERPDELADLPPNRRRAQVHLVTIERWGAPGEQ